MMFLGHASDGYFRAQKEKGSLGIVDAHKDCAGEGLLMCRCIESDWDRLTLSKWPDIDSIGRFRKRLRELKREHGMTAESQSVMGYHNPDRGDLQIPDVPLYRFIKVAHYVTSLSDDLQRSMWAEIWPSVEKNGGQIVGGFRSVEEHWQSFFVEAWETFDGIMSHVEGMRKLMRRYKVQANMQSLIGVRWES